MNAKQFIQQINTASRSKDWRLSFVPFIIGCVYLWFGIFRLEWNLYYLSLFFLSIFTTFGFAAFGYFINDFFDQKEDYKAGKLNKLSVLKTYQIAILFVFICGFTFLPWLYLPKDNTTYCLISLEIFCFLAYSFPVIRLKEKAYLAGILDASYAYLIPAVLSYHTFSLVGNIEVNEGYLLLFFALLFFVGYRNILIHQIKDVLNDSKSGLKTLPKILGITKTKLFFTIIFMVELSLLFGSSVAFMRINKLYGFWAGLVLIYLWKNRLSIKEVLKGSNFILLKENRQSLDLFYQLWFPMMHLFILIFADWKWIVLLPIHAVILVNKDYIIEIWQNAKEIFWHKSTKPLFSFIVNTIVYWLFRLIGINLIKENKSAKEYLKAKFTAK